MTQLDPEDNAACCSSAERSAEVDRLSQAADDFFAAYLNADPFTATVMGVPGHEARTPDPSREFDQRHLRELDSLADELQRIPTSQLADEHWVTADMLGRQLNDRRALLRAGLREVSVSASTFGRLSEVFSLVPQGPLPDARAAEDYLARLAGFGDYFDALAERHRIATSEGRTPTATGLRQAIEQLDHYLSSGSKQDPFLRTSLADDCGVDERGWRQRAQETVSESLRPGLRRYRDQLTELAAETHPGRRPREDNRVGVLHVPGGADGYLAAVRAHTTTDATPEEIHRLGIELIDQLHVEFAELGSRVLGTSDVTEILHRLQQDPGLRFENPDQIESTVTDALRRAEAAVPDWFRSYQIAPCVVQRMGESEAHGGPIAYYMPGVVDGSRRGAHVVNTYRPESRTRFEYEALAFHESVPGHHLQIAVSQSLQGLPDFRRFLIVTAHAEGWGLYVERLCDRMGLYTDDLSRFGMLSFDAWRASRLVVDTGMHAFGWSRDRAIAYMRQNTALSDINIVNEVDRYIADPGQALGYMLGRIRINELAERAQAELGSAFDLREYHHVVLGNGSLALSTLERLVNGWIERNRNEETPA